MRMRLLTGFFGLILLFSTSFVSRTAQAARSSGIGVGIVLGSPTAITGKMYLDSQTGFDVGLAYDFDDYITIYGDYLHHWPQAFSGQREKFIREITPYLGIGGLFHNSDDPYRDRRGRYRRDENVTNFILRIPLGLEWVPPNIPLGVFLEIVPGIYLAPDVASAFMGGIGLRYYFD